ncbi:MAG: 207 kDa replicase polyprotein (domains: methyltransferase - helicase - RNA-dependent RNA polymerase) [Plant associated tobamo-like virus 1]|nr:MAG: 207 kDa replicase polyprotein (domains: methyltransferase - helicase - RNA-dependent RNA polymerase) [Plant associated tobamo-like virus 1]UTQ50507.1 MAG: 207 kDa replicase polyprotein (domains: methyltransferase - helicase - RNA-dependent RNA polymerase) [Plant associated tobamo-like virus 1]UTQ50510.1 MAG: 207 kDa replicase polyprotein (domains: methyltransferase - helicase - RNA-dependent RNA polymerase) [Plant associated tobamo-like virus 1]UTQ50929.1 MAG: 207 kDa replicase polyprote
MSQELLNIATKQLLGDRDSCLVRAVDEDLTRRFREAHGQPSGRKPFMLRIALKPEERDTLSAYFPEFEITYHNTNLYSHGYAAASRKLELEVLMDRSAGIGERIIDVGGNWADHLLMNRPHVHSCCPILDPRDSARQQERDDRVRKVYQNFLKNKSPQELSKTAVHKFIHAVDQSLFVCHKRAEECTVQGKRGIALHSVYDIKFDDLGKIMNAHGLECLHGTFIFFPAILNQSKEGEPLESKELQVVAIKYAKKDIIEFTFKNDPSNCYSHKYSNYIEYVNRTYTVHNGCLFYYELMENRGGIQFFKLIRCNIIPQKPIHRQAKYVWMGNEEVYAVKVYDYGLPDKKLKRSDPVQELSIDYVFVDKLTYERALEYALGIEKEGQPYFHAIYTYMRSINNRVIVNGVNVTSPKRVNADALYKLAIAIYCHAVFMRYCGNQIRDRLDKQMKDYFGILKKGFFSLALSWIGEALTKPGDSFHNATIGPFRLAMIKSMNAVRDRPEYGMQDFYLRFSDYVNLNLVRDKETMRRARLEIEQKLLDLYQTAPEFQFSLELVEWIRVRIVALGSVAQDRFSRLVTRVNSWIRHRNRLSGERTPLIEFSTDEDELVESEPEEPPQSTSQEPPKPEPEKPKIKVPKRHPLDESVSSLDTLSTGSVEYFKEARLRIMTSPKSVATSATLTPANSTTNLLEVKTPAGASVKSTNTSDRPPSIKLRMKKWFRNVVRLRKTNSDYQPPVGVPFETLSVRSEKTSSSFVSDGSVSDVEDRTTEWVSTLPSTDEEPDLLGAAAPLISFEDLEQPELPPPIEPVVLLPPEEPAVESKAPKKVTFSLPQPQTDKVQDPRAAFEFVSYLQAEFEANLSVGMRMWRSLICPESGKADVYNLNAFYNQHEAALLEKTTSGLYRPFKTTIAGCGVACGEYDMAFTVDHFEPCKLLKDGLNDLYQVPATTNHVLVWKDTRLMQCVHMLKVFEKYPHRPNISARVTLVEGVPGCGKTTEIISRAKKGDIILTVARRTKEEIQKKVSRAAGVVVRTVDSYLLNDRKTYPNVFLDEGLMIHAGLIDIIANYSQCNNLFVFGDRNQLNFTNRVADFEVRHHVRKDFDSYEMRNRSYRCPKDVAAIFSPVYDGGFTTTNNVVKSLFLQPIHNMQKVPRNFDIFLVFTQEEKKDLQKLGIQNVNTIHESQGMTYRDVALVRLNFKGLELFDKVKYILVGLTRHTNSFTYFTKKDSDVTSQIIKKVRTVRPSDMEEKIGDHARTVKGLKPMELTFEVESQTQKTCEGDVNVLRTLLLENEHFAVSDNTGLFTQTKLIDGVEFERAKISECKKRNVANDLQVYYDSVLPHGSTEPAQFDEYEVQHSDISVTLENIKLNLARDGDKVAKLTKDTTEYKPVLRTAQPNKRMSSFRQAMLAIMKRNCDTPRNALPSDTEVLFVKTVDAMKKLFLRPDSDAILRSFQDNPIAVTPEGIEQWLCAQEPGKLRRIHVEDDFVTFNKMLNYHMMVKSEPKNKLEPAAVFEYQSPQNIVYHESCINAVFGPMFKILYQRFVQLLAPNVCVMLQKSHKQLEDHMNSNLDPAKEYERLEIDFSKFDKSQTEVCFEIEMAFWQLLGMDNYLLGLWRMGHFSVSATDFQAGIKAYFIYQRKSGDSATAFGNSLVSMLSLAYSATFPCVEAAYFVGDDSLIFLDQKYRHTTMPDVLTKTFNLTSKILEMRTGYFCSTFIIQTVKGFKVIPDPLKRIEKLGKPISIHDEMDLRQRYVSFKELIDPLADEELHEAIAAGMNERYGPSYATLAALNALRIAASDFRVFTTLYQKVDG